MQMSDQIDVYGGVPKSSKTIKTILIGRRRLLYATIQQIQDGNGNDASNLRHDEVYSSLKTEEL